MRSPAKTVDEYLDLVEARWSDVARAVAAIRTTELGEDVAAIRYGMPCWSRGDDAELAFAVQRRHLSLYVMRTAVMAAHRDALSGLSVGKGCVRFPTPGSIDLELVRSLVVATARDGGDIC